MSIRIRLKQIVCCIIGLGVGVVVHAQTPQQQESLRLTLQEAQEHALQHNKNVRNAGLAVSEAQKKVWETISSGLPQVNATLDYQNMLGFKASLGDMFTISMEPTSTLQASVTQLLFNGSYWVGVKMAKIGKEVSEISKLQSELEVKQQTRSAYLSVLVAQENRTILEKSLGDIRTLAKSTADMVAVGVAEQTDADQLKVQVASMENSIKSVERATELAYNLLRFHLGVNMNTEIILTETLDNLLSEEKAKNVLATPFDMENNFNIQLLDKQLEIANRQIRMEQSSCLPSIAMFYNYSYKLKASTFDMTPNNVIGMQASIPIFASGQRHAKIKQAKIRLESSQNDKDLVSDQLLMQEKQLRFNLDNALETFALQKDALEVSQRVLESVTRKYRQGVVSSLDVTTANTSLLQAQSNYISAMNEVIFAQTELETLLNTL